MNAGEEGCGRPTRENEHGAMMGLFGFGRVSKPQSYMFLRHTRENEHGAVIGLFGFDTGFKTTDCTDYTQISTDESWKSARMGAKSRRGGNTTVAVDSVAKRVFIARGS